MVVVVVVLVVLSSPLSIDDLLILANAYIAIKSVVTEARPAYAAPENPPPPPCGPLGASTGRDKCPATQDSIRLRYLGGQRR